MLACTAMNHFRCKSQARPWAQGPAPACLAPSSCETFCVAPHESYLKHKLKFISESFIMCSSVNTGSCHAGGNTSSAALREDGATAPVKQALPRFILHRGVMPLILFRMLLTWTKTTAHCGPYFRVTLEWVENLFFNLGPGCWAPSVGRCWPWCPQTHPKIQQWGAGSRQLKDARSGQTAGCLQVSHRVCSAQGTAPKWF